MWFVSKHKHVNRDMRRIDEAERRTARRRERSGDEDDKLAWKKKEAREEGEEGGGEMVLGMEGVLLDPRCNRPMKLHWVRADELERLATKAQN